MDRTARAALTLGGLALLAGCTSSGGEPTGSARPSTSPIAGTPTTSQATTPTAPSASTPSTSAAGLAGALVLAGPTEDRADVYRIGAGGVTRVTRSADITGVTADQKHVVVSVQPADGDETVRELSGDTTVDLGIAAGFAPAFSSAGLVYAAVDLGVATPGVTKPKRFAILVRSGLRATSRTVYSTPSSLADPQWIGAHDILVAVGGAGDAARILRIDTTTRTARAVATVSGAGGLDLVATSTAAAVGTDDGSVLVTLADGRQHPMPTGWTPLCWLRPDRLLAAGSGHLGTIAVSAAGVADRPVVLGALPAGTSAYAASCDRVG